MQYSEEFINEVLATFPDNAFESPIDQRVEKLTEIYKKFKRQMKIDELYSQSESKNLIN